MRIGKQQFARFFSHLSCSDHTRARVDESWLDILSDNERNNNINKQSLYLTMYFACLKFSSTLIIIYVRHLLRCLREAMEEDAESPDLRCGWRSWKPKFMQHFNSPKWFLFFFTVFSCVQGRIESMENVVSKSLSLMWNILGLACLLYPKAKISICWCNSYIGTAFHRIRWHSRDNYDKVETSVKSIVGSFQCAFQLLYILMFVMHHPVWAVVSLYNILPALLSFRYDYQRFYSGGSNIHGATFSTKQ